MPIGERKNALYGLALPLMGLRCRCKSVQISGPTETDLSIPIARALKRAHTVGGCVQLVRKSALAETYTFGLASLSPAAKLNVGTYFRTASIAKMACALLVMRLQTHNLLDVNEDISAFWGAPIRNPFFPDTPIPLASLLSHTSGIVDSPLYYSSYQTPVSADDILADARSFSPHKPFEVFRYSNFAAGLIGCLLEKRFGETLESLAQRELFQPLDVRATFDLASLAGVSLANDYRVLPPSRTPAFDAAQRVRSSASLNAPDPQTHYLLASGGLFITAEGLARLTLPLIHGGTYNSALFINPTAIEQMKTPLSAWPNSAVRMRHGMGLLELNDPSVCSQRLYGHQGFAYGAVNGVFFNDNGDGFASLNSGASEQRTGHLSCLNRDLIRTILGG
jgi:CubicO group peptidase (beta-lactamase class C family)